MLQENPIENVECLGDIVISTYKNMIYFNNWKIKNELSYLTLKEDIECLGIFPKREDLLAIVKLNLK